jgi:hypothetical protein
MYRRDEKGHIVKELDHLCFSADTIVYHKTFGKTQISNLTNTTGEVLTQYGWQQYSWAGLVKTNTQLVEVVFENGEIIKCTPDHKFLTESGWIEAQNLIGYKVLCGSKYIKTEHKKWKTLSLFQKKFNCLMKLNFTGKAKMDTLLTIGVDTTEDCTELFGRPILERFRLDIISTILTKTKQTIASKIYNVFLRLNIYNTTASTKNQSLYQKQHLMLQQSGTGLKKAWHGIKCMLKTYGDVKNRPQNIFVYNADVNLKQHKTNQVAVHKLVENVNHKGLLEVHALNYLSNHENVYCLTVPATNSFVVGDSEFVVHNCDSARYLVMSIDKATTQLVEQRYTPPVSSSYRPPLVKRW